MSSRNFSPSFPLSTTSNMLLDVKKTKTALLTVQLPLDIYLDYMTAVDVLRSRSAAELTHHAVLREIDRAKKQTTPELWEEYRVERQQNYEQRSKLKTKERARGLKIRGTAPVASKKKAS